MVGTTLGHYRVLEKLGAGGMGEVYAAEDTKLQRRVALKRLPPDMATDPERLQRFRREARAIAALNHPNVVTVYSVEEADGVQFLTMELVEGKTLGELIPPDGLPPEELLQLALPLVDAVAAAHRHGIVHRDLKPANVMLASDGRLKVLDFGLSKLRPDVSTTATTCLETHSLTSAHAIVGTAAYMSPEQAEGRPVDHRSDIFSLGVVLYELASGRRPFVGDTVFSLISSIIKDPPVPLADVKRDVPPALDRIVTKALAKAPAERYQSARELHDALREVQQQTAVGWILRGIVWAVARSRWTRRLALAAGLVTLVAGGAWYLVAGRDGAGRRTQPATIRFRTDQLTAHPGVEQFPSLTPDGKWVVYAGQGTGNWDIYIQSTTAGENPINLTAGSPAEDNEPAVSRDGGRIAFRSSRDGGGIFVMERSGEGVRRVTPVGVSAAFNPTWSPEGTEIAYATEDVQLTPLNWEGRTGLWVVNVNTGAQRSLEIETGVQPSWSPHGHRIAYIARPRRTGADAQTGSATTRVLDLWTIPARGGEPVQVTSDPAADWSPAWSPDGRYLYFVSGRGGSMNLWRVAIDEVSGKTLAAPQPVTTPAQFLAHPSVSGDGRLIAYCAKLETGNIQKIALDPVTATVQGEPTWVTTGSQAWANPDVTRDGEWVVAYTREQPEGDLYIMRSDGTGRRRQLTAEPEIVDRVPRWSPDKTWVAFFSTRQGDTELWKIRFDGAGRQQMSPYGGIAAWSPDGTRLAVSTRDPNKGDERITYLLNPTRSSEAQTPQALPRLEGAFRRFIAQDWSPDGARLVGQLGFTASRGDGIVVYTFNTRRYERVAEFGEWPVWLPDGRRALFVANGKDYWVVDTRTKRTQKIYSVPRGVLGPARLTRDGRIAVFPLRLVDADIYLLRFE